MQFLKLLFAGLLIPTSILNVRPTLADSPITTSVTTIVRLLTEQTELAAKHSTPILANNVSQINKTVILFVEQQCVYKDMSIVENQKLCIDSMEMLKTVYNRNFDLMIREHQ